MQPVAPVGCTKHACMPERAYNARYICARERTRGAHAHAPRSHARCLCEREARRLALEGLRPLRRNESSNVPNSRLRRLQSFLQKFITKRATFCRALQKRCVFFFFFLFLEMSHISTLDFQQESTILRSVTSIFTLAVSRIGFALLLYWIIMY